MAVLRFRARGMTNARRPGLGRPLDWTDAHWPSFFLLLNTLANGTDTRTTHQELPALARGPACRLPFHFLPPPASVGHMAVLAVLASVAASSLRPKHPGTASCLWWPWCVRMNRGQRRGRPWSAQYHSTICMPRPSCIRCQLLALHISRAALPAGLSRHAARPADSSAPTCNLFIGTWPRLFFSCMHSRLDCAHT